MHESSTSMLSSLQHWRVCTDASISYRLASHSEPMVYMPFMRFLQILQVQIAEYSIRPLQRGEVTLTDKDK